MDFELNRKAQVTVFVITALLIVAGIAILISLNRNKISSKTQDFDNPERYISLCIKEQAQKIIDQMLAGGGFVNPLDTTEYNYEKYTYLCKNINNFDPCINQYPTYVSLVEKEFENQISSSAQDCFAYLKKDLEDKKYSFDSSPISVEASLKPEVIQLTILSDVSISKNEISKTYSRFDSFIPTKMYWIVKIANEIVNDEAVWCYFDHDEYMRLNSGYDIRLKIKDDAIKIYTIKNLESGEVLKFAVRGCVAPAGYFDE